MGGRGKPLSDGRRIVSRGGCGEGEGNEGAGGGGDHLVRDGVEDGAGGGALDAVHVRVRYTFNRRY